jgi:Acetokinase family
VRVTETVLDDLAKLEPLAPLHQPHNLAPIRAIMKAAPQIPQIACFDTAFHRAQSNLAQAFALPRRFCEEGVRRYGFHGLSYEFLASRLRELAPELAGGRIGSGRIDPLWIEAGRSWQTAGRNQSPIILADRWDPNGVALTTRQS